MPFLWEAGGGRGCTLGPHSVLFFTHLLLFSFHVSCYKLASRARGIFHTALGGRVWCLTGRGDKKKISLWWLIEDSTRQKK